MSSICEGSLQYAIEHILTYIDDILRHIDDILRIFVRMCSICRQYVRNMCSIHILQIPRNVGHGGPCKWYVAERLSGRVSLSVPPRTRWRGTLPMAAGGATPMTMNKTRKGTRKKNDRSHEAHNVVRKRVKRA